jgi:hypothetical protein
MEKIKPNKFAECLKATEQFGIEVPDEITKVESERFYHLLLVEEVHRPKLKKYDKRVSIIKLNQTDYITKIKGASTKGSRSNVMALLGYTNLFVLHDPTIKPTAKKKPAVKKTIESK